MGGQLLSFYNCFGEYDGVVIFRAPDEATATIITAITPGHELITNDVDATTALEGRRR